MNRDEPERPPPPSCTGGEDQAWITREEAARLTGLSGPTIEHAVRRDRIAHRPARGIMPTLDRVSVLAWAAWYRDQVEQREARRRERDSAVTAWLRLYAPRRPEDHLLGPPDQGEWWSLPTAAERCGVAIETISRWLGDGRLDGVQRAQWWVTAESVDRLLAERREDAEKWVSIAAACDIVGCSDALIAELVREGLIVQRRGPRGQASIQRESAEHAAVVLAARREAVRVARARRAAMEGRSHAPDDGHVWLSVRTTALVLGLSHSGTTARIRVGTLPATLRGRRWWVRREDAEQAAAARAFEARRDTH